MFCALGVCVGGARSHPAAGLLFLDEPTSGLDSTTAHHLIGTLKALCVRGRTVVCTIHQPRSDIFAQFDTLMLLARGQLVYFGAGEALVPYLRARGYPCPKYTNPADYASTRGVRVCLCSHTCGCCVVDLITVDTRTPTAEKRSLARVTQLVTSFAQASTLTDARSASSTDTHTPTHTPLLPAIEHTSLPSPSPLYQFWILYRRASQNVIRDRLSFLSKLVYSLFVALLFGAISYNLGRDQVGVQDRIGTLNIMLSLTPFMAILACIVQCA